MPELFLFLPILLFPIGALVLAYATSRAPAGGRAWLPLLLLILELAAVLVNIAPINHRVAVSDWPLASFSIVFEMDGTGLLLLLIGLVVLLSLWLASSKRTALDPFAALVQTSAFLLIIAGNLPAIYFAWVVLDGTIFLWRLARDIERDTALRALAVSQLAGLLLFAGISFANTPYSHSGSLLIALAFWARLGLFPFHWTLPLRGADSRDFWNVRGAPLMAAATPWIRWEMLLDKPALPVEWIALLAAMAMVTAVIWSWHMEQPSRVALVGAWHAVALIPLAALYGGDGAPAYTLWLTVGSVIAIALFEMALRWRAQTRNRWARLLWFGGILSIAGLPLTPAFIGRLGLYASLWESGAGWLILVASTATTLILAPLWDFGISLASPEPRMPTLSETTALGLVTSAFAALSLAPMLITQALSPAMGAFADAALRRLVTGDNLAGVLVGGVGLIAPIVLSLLLRSVSSASHQHPMAWLTRLARASDLEWLANLLGGIGFQMSRIARTLTGIAEENPTVWILLVALWIAIFVLLPR